MDLILLQLSDVKFSKTETGFLPSFEKDLFLSVRVTVAKSGVSVSLGIRTI